MQGEILRSGGVLALVHRILDTGGHERVRAAACDSLATLGDDGLIAVQVRAQRRSSCAWCPSVVGGGGSSGSSSSSGTSAQPAQSS